MKKNKFVICDDSKCIGCATCMAACYSSAYERGKLAVSRLNVLRSATGVMVTQCRQCDDGPCASVCPTGALSFGSDYIESNEELCIGCKLCTLACPYGAITIHAEKMPSINYAVEPKYNLYIESEPGAKSIALKCDLCYGDESGPNCIQVCPTSALVFIDADRVMVNANKDAQKFVEKVKGQKVNSEKKLEAKKLEIKELAKGGEL